MIIDRTERQKLGVQKWIDNKCRGTLCYPTGAGKTNTAIIAIKRFLTKNNNKKILVVVPTEHLKNQWITVLSSHFLITSVDVQIINSAINIIENIDLLILDELHRYASNEFYKIFLSKKPKLILGLTATFERLDGKHTLLEKYAPIVDEIKLKEALSNGWLSKYKEYKIILEVDLSEYKRIHAEFIEHFSFFDYRFDIAMKSLKSETIRKNIAKILKVDLKVVNAHSFGFNRALQKRKSFVMNHEKKIEIAEKILSKRVGSKAITFNATISQCEKYSSGYVLHSKKTKKTNRLTMEEFDKLNSGVIHSSKALNEGLDIKGLNLAIILHNNSSKLDKIQKIGRVIRKEENKEAEIFTLVIKGTMEESWFNSSSKGSNFIEIYEDELDDVLNYNFIGEEQEQTKDVNNTLRF